MNGTSIRALERNTKKKNEGVVQKAPRRPISWTNIDNPRHVQSVRKGLGLGIGHKRDELTVHTVSCESENVKQLLVFLYTYVSYLVPKIFRWRMSLNAIHTKRLCNGSTPLERSSISERLNISARVSKTVAISRNTPPGPW